MRCPRDGDPSVVHAWGAAAIVCAAIAIAGCIPTASGATIAYVPGRKPTKLVDLEHLGQPPAGAPMCMPGETGCIETGWGPGWDVDKGREGQLKYRHMADNRRSHELGERATQRKNPRGEPCSVYWENDEDLGSAPVGSCGP